MEVSEIKTLRQIQDEYILIVLHKYKGVRLPAARALGMTLRNLYTQLGRIKEVYGLESSTFVCGEWHDKKKAFQEKKIHKAKTKNDLFWEVEGMPTNEERIEYLNDITNRDFL